MRHRHLNHSDFTLAAIDDYISRGKKADWDVLLEAASEQPELRGKIRQICAAHIKDPYAQRYHLWWNYVQRYPS